MRAAYGRTLAKLTTTTTPGFPFYGSLESEPSKTLGAILITAAPRRDAAGLVVSLLASHLATRLAIRYRDRQKSPQVPLLRRVV